MLTSSRALGDYFDESATRSGDPKAAANWVMGEVLAALKATGQTIDELRVRPRGLGELLGLVRDGVVSHTAAKQVFAVMAERGGEPRAIAEREGLLKVTDDDALARWIDEVFAEHPGEAGRFLGGERRLQGVLVGLVMKKSNGARRPEARESVAGDARPARRAGRGASRSKRAPSAGNPNCRSASS